jgi:glyoxylase-like metal-dependent hydrolase (beta-lactamase superfamily II)
MKIADRWFERHSVDDGITLLRETHVHPIFQCNIWVVEGRDSNMLVDTGMGIVSLKDEIQDFMDKPLVAVGTHYHSDHVGSLHEFEDRVIHSAEASLMAPYEFHAPLANFPPGFVDYFSAAGYELDWDMLIDALPHVGYDVDAYTVPDAPPTRVVDEGDRIDLGDRDFEVVHLPGHSPGNIGLWEESTGVLFTGDSIYDGPLLDDLDDSNVEHYLETMERLKTIPANVVHGGHDPSFGRERLIDLADAYITSRTA